MTYLFQAHLQHCPKVLTQCIVGCGKEIPRDAMEAHVTEDCPNAEKLCPFRIHGCDFKVSENVTMQAV